MEVRIPVQVISVIKPDHFSAIGNIFILSDGRTIRKAIFHHSITQEVAYLSSFLIIKYTLLENGIILLLDIDIDGTEENVDMNYLPGTNYFITIIILLLKYINSRIRVF
jgi:hypothetical protein